MLGHCCLVLSFEWRLSCKKCPPPKAVALSNFMPLFGGSPIPAMGVQRPGPPPLIQDVPKKESSPLQSSLEDGLRPQLQPHHSLTSPSAQASSLGLLYVFQEPSPINLLCTNIHLRVSFPRDPLETGSFQESIHILEIFWGKTKSFTWKLALELVTPREARMNWNLL